jgi:hypothetical protein
LQTRVTTLEVELLELREFHAAQSALKADVSSQFMQDTTIIEPEMDTSYESMARLAVVMQTPSRSIQEELEFMKQQCREYERLLAMAKEEIRLSHQELMAEKKRIKILEMENLTRRETELELMMKVQSLMNNQPIAAKQSPTQKMPFNASVATRVYKQEVMNESNDPAHVNESMEGSNSRTNDQRDDACWLHRFFHERFQPLGKRIEMEKASALKSFIISLAATSEQQLSVLQRQHNIKHHDKVPSIAPSTVGVVPVISAKNPPIKSKVARPQADASNTGDSISTTEWARDPDLVRSVRQIMWFLYERYLMVEEAQQLCLSSQPPPSSSLAALVVHFFWSDTYRNKTQYGI